MRILNLGCGSVRPQGEEWTNLDNLFEQLPPGSPERENLQKESNYSNFDIFSGPLPFKNDCFDCVMASHIIEHFDAIEGLKLIQECRRVLKQEGELIVSVPDCSYFKQVIALDNMGNAVELFGEPIHIPDGHDNFFDYALWMRQHKAILNHDSLWCYFKRAGFKAENIRSIWTYSNDIIDQIRPVLNRLKFSVVLAGKK